jgi:hypothetical protein
VGQEDVDDTDIETNATMGSVSLDSD